MTDGGEQRHAVVFDCNAYLDVGRVLGSPFSWDAFNDHLAQLSKVAVPHPTDRMHDSLRAIALCTSGRFAGDEVLEVWTSAHIDKIVRGKAMQSVEPDPETGYFGLGWSREHAQGMVSDLIGTLTEQSNGGTLGDGPTAASNPPLDHEDGMVYGACAALAGNDPLCNVYCVTKDRGFLTAYANGELATHTRVITPSKFIGLVRTARNACSIRRMLPP